MTRREIREEIFKLLFEHELIDNNIEKRINDVINEENLKKNDEIDFLRSYVTEIIGLVTRFTIKQEVKYSEFPVKVKLLNTKDKEVRIWQG